MNTYNNNNCVMKLYSCLCVWPTLPHFLFFSFLFRLGSAFKERTRKEKNCPEGCPALLHHSDILTNQILMFKVSVVSGALRTGAAIQQRAEAMLWHPVPPTGRLRSCSLRHSEKCFKLKCKWKIKMSNFMEDFFIFFMEAIIVQCTLLIYLMWCRSNYI